MSLDRVIEVLSPSSVVGRAPSQVRDLAYDPAAVRPGALFFCVRGSRVDGHELARDAVERGAVALVVERPVDAPVPQVVVPSVREAMPVVAAEFFGHPSREVEVVGVTGTNGKTTTAYLLHSILLAAGRKPGLLGNIVRRVGAETRPAVLNTPEAIDLQRLLREMADAGDRSCAMEASSHASAQHRLDGVHFAALVFTNLTQDHLDFHGTMEAYFAAKRRLFVLEPRPPAVVNIGDPWGARLAEELIGGSAPVVTFGLVDGADVSADQLELGPAGARFRVGRLVLETPLRGRFNVENVLGAVVAARTLGVADPAIAAGVAALRSVPGRLEPVDEGQPFTVLVDYSHKPDALAAALSAVRDLTKGRVLCVFGCGGDRDRTKRPVMGSIAGELADVAILTSDNPRSEDPDAIIAEVAVGAPEGSLEIEPDRRAAIRRAVELAAPGDVVLVAGKGHEPGQEIAGVVHPFDDREVAREVLRRLGAPA
jgi:UDP-N-acetylmuramoyl-L-alanyl-D-glutamate--2,6-diaminopimelate ligase